jgi:hypothetical protein
VMDSTRKRWERFDRWTEMCSGCGGFLIPGIVFMLVVAGIVLLIYGTHFLDQANHGLSTGYVDAECSAMQNAGVITGYCTTDECTSKIPCCDYPVTIRPAQPYTSSGTVAKTSFNASILERECKMADPCVTFRATLTYNATWGPTLFPCKFSPEKMESRLWTNNYCLLPGIDPDYFGPCAIVTDREFGLLVAADKIRKRDKPFFAAMIPGGACCLAVGTTMAICFYGLFRWRNSDMAAADAADAASAAAAAGKQHLI